MGQLAPSALLRIRATQEERRNVAKIQLQDPRNRFLFVAASLGFMTLVAGLTIGTLTQGKASTLSAVVLEALGSAIMFPILVSFTYDRLRERWFGDEVWRIFNELSDAGITRIYRDRESSYHPDNAQQRLANEFRTFQAGEILMMGVSLRVFFNPLGPFYRDICSMLEGTRGNVRIKAMICDPGNPDIPIRAGIEEPSRDPRHKTQIDRDLEDTVVTVAGLRTSYRNRVDLKYYMASPYCTTVIFPHVCYYSPNLLAPGAPVRLPMILFLSRSNGYSMVKASFDYLWRHPVTKDAVC